MRQVLTTLMLCAIVLLPACQTTGSSTAPPAAPLTAEQLAEAKATWLGTWSGAWGKDGGCPSTITVRDVTSTSAVAHYTWGGGCGGRGPGSHTDENATLSGNVLQMAFTFGWGARYTMMDDGNLAGEWWSKGRRHTASATFYKQ